MNRRSFLSALIAAPVAHELEPVRRVYSFLWSNPVGVQRHTEAELAAMKAEIDECMNRMAENLSALYWGPPMRDPLGVWI